MCSEWAHTHQQESSDKHSGIKQPCREWHESENNEQTYFQECCNNEYDVLAKKLPIGSDESTIIASYFPSGASLKKSTAAKKKSSLL
jgi:hypothetical protein